jgi:hypothetical protein
MIFDRAASLLTPRFHQRIPEPRKETFALFGLCALGNGCAGGRERPHRSRYSSRLSFARMFGNSAAFAA